MSQRTLALLPLAEAAVYARDAWEAHGANLVDAQWTSLAQPGRDLLQVRT
jgi:hypothetical protein